MSKIRVSWFLRNTRKSASSRLQGYVIHEALCAEGMDSKIVLAPPFEMNHLPWRDDSIRCVGSHIQSDVVIFQKIVDPRVEVMISELKERGIKTIYSQCDYRPYNKLPLLCDHVVVPSRVLYNYFVDNGAPCTEIPDPIEYIISLTELTKRYQEPQPNEDTIRLVWVGNKTHWNTLDELRNILEKPKYRHYQLTTISNHPSADYQWQLHSVRDQILRANIGVVPTVSGLEADAKSHNRATLFMGLGLPVITGEHPSYRQIISNGKTGFIAGNRGEWETALDALADSKLRFQLALDAYTTVVPNFELSLIVQCWKTLIEQICSPTTNNRFVSNHQWARLQFEANLDFFKGAFKRHLWAASMRYFAKTAVALFNAQVS